MLTLIDRYYKNNVQSYRYTFSLTLRRTPMNMNVAIEPILAIVMGILILLVPRFLNYIVAVYLIVVGILGLMHHVTIT